MDLETLHAELVALRKEIRAYHNATISNKTDIVWIKRIVFGALTVVFTLVGALTKKVLNF
jgi:hypothetical protein